MKRTAAGICGLALFAASAQASASPINITNIEGAWQNALPVLGTTVINNVPSPGTDTIRWGVPLETERSGYDFDVGPNILGVVLGIPFSLGTFTHVNRVLAADTSISSVEYAFQFATDGTILSNLFIFSQNETDNTSPGCCDDIVTISPLHLTQFVSVGGDSYSFNLLGFSANGGSTFSNVFSSPEGGVNAVGLYGVFTPTAIPEPATLFLVASGLAAAGSRAYRSRSRSRRKHQHDDALMSG
jgi:hypothetical protein